MVEFKRDVYPILESNCFGCHRGMDCKSGVRLDQREELIGKSNGKPLVVPGKSEESRLVQILAGEVPGTKMPPKGQPLTNSQIANLRSWIDQGLVWDDELLPPEKRPAHWAFQPVKHPAVPSLKDRSWIRTPVDAFIGARHEAKGLVPAAGTERRLLVRRITLDLTGLPPTIEETRDAVADPSLDWYEKVVDRLLASPRYGERWGRHWLDLARWAETEGYESDQTRDYAWRYRDYVVQSFNADKPYGRFLLEQIAGDELEPYADTNLIATGFLAAARLSSNEEDKYQQRNDILVDIVNATGSTVLGLTFQCAQCHNHKFDPITARDYYRFQGFFIKGAPNNLVLKDPKLTAAYQAAKSPDYDTARKLKQLLFEAARNKLLDEARNTLTPAEAAVLRISSARRSADQEKLARQAELKLQPPDMRVERAISNSPEKTLYQELTTRLTTLEKTMPDAPQTFGFYSPLTAVTRIDVLPAKGFHPPEFNHDKLAESRPYLLVAGDVHQRGEEVDIGWPAVFGATPGEAVARSPRTVLANWFGRADHPLTARVWVNRIWQWHFGRGLVATSSDFGIRGAQPSHPELLDWLASELVRSGWSTKHIHRLIVRSSTYRQSTANHSANVKIDPENIFLWRWSTRRLEAESLRDSMLAVSGELDTTMGGPSDKDDATSVRRALYLFQKRNKPPELQKLFDGPAGATESCSMRGVSTVPLQALYLLNHEFAINRARAIAGRIQKTVGADQVKQIEKCFLTILGRAPDAVEREDSRRFFETMDRGDSKTLEFFCQVLLSLNEFAYLP